MYALKARDKLHKREKERYEKDKSPKAGKRGGERSRDRDSRPTTVRREAKVSTAVASCLASQNNE